MEQAAPACWEALQHFDRKVLPSLDGIRGFAVLLVLFYHNISVHIPGPMGVEIFFVLSGFLITRLLVVERDKAGTISIRSFYWRRAVRIFPVFYLYMIAVAAVDHVTPGYYWSGITYTLNYYVALHGNQGNTMYHLWSLAVEEQFYLLWPFTFFLFRNRLDVLKRCTAIVIALSQIYKLVIMHYVSSDHIYRSFDTRGPEILTGCLLALLLHHSRKVPEWLLSRAVLLVGLLELCVSASFADATSVTYFHLVDSVVIAVVMMQAIHYAPRILNRGPLKFLGFISYSLYVYHPMMLLAAGSLHLRWSLTVLLSMSMAVAVAALSRYTFEAWFLKLKSLVRPAAPANTILSPASASASPIDG
jgi:peptidoglycan/LPS O-acetylase OafA/YrhL